MKTFFCIVLSLFITKAAIPQCGFQTTTRADGTKIYGTLPKLLGHNNSDMQLGISVESNGSSDYIALTLRFKSIAKKIKSNIDFVLNNNEVITLKLFKTNISNIGDNQVCLAIFEVNEIAFSKFKKSNIKKISFSTDDNIMNNIIATSNQDCIKNIVNCLEAKLISRNSTQSNDNKKDKNTTSKTTTINPALEEKNGFKDLKLGMTKEAALLLYHFKPGDDNIPDYELFYTYDVSSKIGDASVENIYVTFIDNKLVNISVELNWGILDILEAAYGTVKKTKGTVGETTIEGYTWNSKNLELSYIKRTSPNHSSQTMANTTSELHLYYSISNYDELLTKAKKKLALSKAKGL